MRKHNWFLWGFTAKVMTGMAAISAIVTSAFVHQARLQHGDLVQRGSDAHLLYGHGGRSGGIRAYRPAGFADRMLARASAFMQLLCRHASLLPEGSPAGVAATG